MMINENIFKYENFRNRSYIPAYIVTKIKSIEEKLSPNSGFYIEAVSFDNYGYDGSPKDLIIRFVFKTLNDSGHCDIVDVFESSLPRKEGEKLFINNPDSLKRLYTRSND